MSIHRSIEVVRSASVMSATKNERVDSLGVSCTSVLCALDMRVCGLLAALMGVILMLPQHSFDLLLT